MKKCFLMLIMFSFGQFSFSQSKEVIKVRARVEQLKNAMVNADSSLLEALTSENLSYGHSGGTVEGKEDFIKKIVSGKSDFVSIEILDDTTFISGDVAVVRYKMNGITNDNGTAGEIHLKILLVWKKEHKNWRLLARQAVKI